MKRHRYLQVMTTAVLAASLAACGPDDASRPATQVVAKVNADEITVYQVNNALARRPDVTVGADPRVKREVLDSLIDRQLAKQQALEWRLDRMPAVLAALEAARTEIMARAYVEQVAANQPQPTPEEIRRYYIENPALFAQRRIYTLEEITLEPREELAAQLREQTRRGRSLREIAAWLKTRDIPFREASGTRAAEQLPMEHLPAMQQLRDGESRLFEANGGLQVIRLVASKPEPLDEQTAAPRIRQYLINQRSSQAVAENMKRLKENAKIEYVGEFAQGTTGAQAKTEPQSGSRSAGEATPARHDGGRKEAVSRPQQLSQEIVEKGIRSLR